ncbi:MAG: GGDEF domain-containing protein [Hylemonella sp.]|uniref:GGDEF domain-containing protein n=1 Tax=Hylemonella sp. TaxID=2066020 RepID=UPI0022BBB6D6|nr:GGDEF domain-containing protein [Hylemonella sp.]MCZ8252185.1 GGDEF domain-containing protein [Hylemonella sp.]
MQFDPTTLIFLNIANLLAMSMALPLVMGQNLSRGAHDARLSLMIHASAWLALIFAGFWREQWPDWLLSTLAMALLSLSNYLIFRALSHWLGPRPLGRLLWVLVIATPVGYALSFQSYPVRVGWANLLIAAQLLILARAALWPQTEFGRGAWRYLLFGCVSVMAVFTGARGILGAWFTELYPYFRAPTPVNLAALVAANVTLVLGNIAILAAWREEVQQQLRTLVITDALTGLLNRSGWAERADKALRHAQRHSQPLGLLMLDLDYFKRINDTHGHEAGDEALAFFGALLQRCQRAGDVSARLGGEEFCVLLTQAGPEAAQAFDRRLRAELVHATPQARNYRIDFSTGHAQLAPQDTLETLMARADAALYRAKHAGRGHLVSADLPA